MFILSHKIKIKSIICVIYFIAVGLFILSSLSNFFSIGCAGANNCIARWENWKYLFAVLILVAHGSYTLGWRKIWWFIFLSAGIGFVSEYISLHYGFKYGVEYFYNKNFAALFDVPYLVLIFWTFFIYTGYCITNSFLVWTNKKKPGRANKDFKRIFLLASVDASLVLVIDFFMEPIMVARGAWQWIDNGAYFGIPSCNFIGWWLVAFISTLIFRSIEYKLKEKNFDVNFLLMPVVGYALIALDFLIAAWLLDLQKFLLIGFPLMSAVAAYNFYLYFKFRKII
jgi:uncharacterized membrane protein